MRPRSIIPVILFTLVSCAASGPKKGVPYASAGGPVRPSVWRHGGWVIVRGAMHNHTTMSEGRRTPEDLVAEAWTEGMGVVAITDHREGKICLGRSKTLCLAQQGIENYGYDRYFEELNKARSAAKSRGMVLLPGFEAFPLIYNQGRFPAMVLRGSLSHFTVYGITDPETCRNMPAARSITWGPAPDPGEKPLQEFVDYMTGRGGLVFAAHPAHGADDWVGPVHAVNPPPVYNLLLGGLTGFASLPEGVDPRTTGPGGLWDLTLAEYLAGGRDRPLWTIGDTDYHSADGGLLLANTLFYLRELSEAEVWAALREGRTAAVMGEGMRDVYVSEWWVSDGATPSDLVMLGAETKVSGTPRVRFSLSREVAGLTLRLIRNGRVVFETRGSRFTFDDPEAARMPGRYYYRVEVVGDGAAVNASGLASGDRMFVNPIFSQTKQD